MRVTDAFFLIVWEHTSKRPQCCGKRGSLTHLALLEANQFVEGAILPTLTHSTLVFGSFGLPLNRHQGTRHNKFKFKF